MPQKHGARPALLLTAGCIALNVLLVWLTGLTGVPLYLDSVGTVIAAALGGLLPGITAGFLSNCITALISVSPDPMTLYYGFLNVLIAAAAYFLSRAGLLRRWYGRLLAVICFSVIGGALGSVVTWVLYGFSFGQGISAPLAQLLYERMAAGQFAAQFAADLCIDLADKLVTVALLWAAFELLPERLLAALPLGHIYLPKKKRPTPAELREAGIERLREERRYRKHSIRTKITLLIVGAASVLSIIALAISIVSYRRKNIEQYSAICADAVDMALGSIDGDRVDAYLAEGADAVGYAETEARLYGILNNLENLKYLYVYRILPDGCHVVFDLDTPELSGEAPGSVVHFDESFPYLAQAITGEAFPPFITDDTYGWLLTVYKPLLNSAGRVVAYAAADIDMQQIKTDCYSFFISIASLLFGVVIVITAVTLWYCDTKLLEPIHVLTEQARDFDYAGTNTGERVRDRHTVQTGDELEEVFAAMCRTEDAIAGHVHALNEKSVEISHMQRNIIYTLANMVENRDENTGGHIRRTAAYVRLLGRKLQESGLYLELVDDAYLKRLFDSAPLHDIGKVKIPDAVLNKPGKLTAEEFALMKTHAAEGAAILRSSLSEIEDGDWLSVAIEMAGSHHERWDGTGYPKGLAGEDIPLCARIMAISDVFDALVSRRSYKEPFAFDEAMQLIRDGAGTQFDPQLAALFCAAEDEVRQISAQQ